MAPAKTRYESLDAWRGLACLMVVVHHSAGYVTGQEFQARIASGGASVGDWILVGVEWFWIGVPLFFVISGYCIAASANAARTRTHGARQYFARRFHRIYPPLVAALALATFLSLAALHLPSGLRPGPSPHGITVWVDPRALSGWQWLGNLTLTEEWRPVVGGPPRGYLLGQTWTLCYEEQFYLVMGLLVLVARRWFFAGVCVVTMLVLLNSLDLNAIVGRHVGLDLNAHQIRVPGLFINGLWVAFAAGVALYFRLTRPEKAAWGILELILLALTLLWAMQEADWANPAQSMSKFNALGCSFAVVLCMLHRFDTSTAQAACLAPLRFCGRMCYSLYLIHPLATVPVAWLCFRAGLTSSLATLLVTVPISMMVSVALGWGFYRLIERRFLNSPVSPSPVPTATTYTAPELSPPPRTLPCPVAESPCLPSRSGLPSSSSR